MSFRTDMAKARGLGSAKDGTHHWVSQRLTAIALIPLTLAFLYPFATSLGSGYEAVRETYQNPIHALVAILTFLVMFRHLRLGIQIVVEDYVHGPRLRAGLLITNALIWRGFAVIGIFAVAKIAFGA